MDVNEMMTEHGLTRDEAAELVRHLKAQDLVTWMFWKLMCSILAPQV